MITGSLTLFTSKDREQLAIWQVAEKSEEHQANQQNMLLTIIAFIFWRGVGISLAPLPSKNLI
ncbi:hypothetical protein [Psychrobacter pygoscelis]|uniref:hypothetical protein n=1 Tax=Psychrobacter pygoscelis TaxID=2488563 RepID=UPI00104078BB|nr:hypothetical protein [Psychrobacter pygoscelis]